LNPEAESEMSLLIDIITGIRNVRGEMNVSPSLALEATVQSPQAVIRDLALAHQDMILNLAKLKSLTVTPPGGRPKAAATSILKDAVVFVSLEGILDFTKEAERLEKEIHKLTGELASVSRKLNNTDFLKKAPAEVVQKVKEKNGDLVEKQQKLMSNLERIKAMTAD
jgi:valyl-tRNA synthetase